VSAIFYVVAFVSFVQLLICCFAEYKRLKNPTFLKAFRVTTQKLLYFVVFLASLLRAAYFTQPESVQPSWAYYLMSAFYPLLMTCASLVICCWAEVCRWNREDSEDNLDVLPDFSPARHPMGAAVPLEEFPGIPGIQHSSLQSFRS
jgi:cytochrome bd-type quinol oxidase subunit 2